MAFRILVGESVEDGIRRIAHEQIAQTVDDLEASGLGDHEAVHDARKRCKKIRALIRLVGPDFKRCSAENAWFRDAARRLSDVRDATTLIECFDALMTRFDREIDREALAWVREALVRRRDAVAATLSMESRLVEFRDAMNATHARVDEWSLEEGGYASVRSGLEKTYRSARKAMRQAYADPTVEHFHEWRKQVKYHRYHMGLLRGAWKPVIGALYREIRELSDLLGDDHDLAVLRATLIEETDRFGPERDLQPLLALIDQRRRELQAKARPTGDRLFAEKPGRFGRRMGRIWRAWRSERKLTSAERSSRSSVALRAAAGRRSRNEQPAEAHAAAHG